MPENIVTTRDNRVRARQRRLLARPFSLQGMIDQSPVLENYIDVCMGKLKTVSRKGPVNMVEWVTFFTVDVIADLAIGESLHCLENAHYHTWVQTLHLFFRGMILASAISFVPGLETILYHTVAKPVLAKQREHSEFTNEKILHRLALKTQRPDFITPFLKDMEKVAPEDQLSIGEIQSTFAILLAAGSDTTSTSLCGLFYKMACYPKVQEELSQILRDRFKSEEEMTVASTGDIPLLDACIKEAMRLCYPLPGGLPRESPKGGSVFLGEFVPEGVSIYPYPPSAVIFLTWYRLRLEFVLM